MNFWKDLPVGDKPPELLNMVIEVTSGSRDKYEYNLKWEAFVLDYGFARRPRSSRRSWVARQTKSTPSARAIRPGRCADDRGDHGEHERAAELERRVHESTREPLLLGHDPVRGRHRDLQRIGHGVRGAGRASVRGEGAGREWRGVGG